MTEKRQRITDEVFMRIALKLAARAKGKTNPNPMVGAVIVKNGRIIAKGYHKKAGQAHAEIIALNRAGKHAKGATLYITLEPCSHYGKTPPCTDAIIQSGVKRVVAAMVDPNPVNNGRSIKLLRAKKLKVEVGLCRDDARGLNKVFIKYITKSLPYVTVKIAQSIDGKIATRHGESKWITDEPARIFVRKLRSQVDAIITGNNTIIKDDPLLTAAPFKKNPVKVILDSRLKTPLTSKIFSKKSPALTIIAATKKSFSTTKDRYAKVAKVMLLKDKNEKVGLRYLLKKLAKMEISHVLVEAGGQVAASFIEEDLVDEIYCFIAPKIIGGKDAPTSVEGKGIGKLDMVVRLSDISSKKIGNDLLIHGYFEKSKENS